MTLAWLQKGQKDNVGIRNGTTDLEQQANAAADAISSREPLGLITAASG